MMARSTWVTVMRLRRCGSLLVVGSRDSGFFFTCIGMTWVDTMAGTFK